MRYTVTIQPANIQFTAVSTETILAAALTADIDLPYGCQGGACGSCMVSKIQGDVRYPNETPPALDKTDIEMGKILCCQAFACSDVELEVPSISINKSKILTLPTRVYSKNLSNSEQLVLTLKLPGQQHFPDYIIGQHIEILAGAGKICLAKRLSNHDPQHIRLAIPTNEDDSYITYLIDNLNQGEMLRIRGPV